MMFSPIIFFYGFFIFLVFVIGVAPTAFWQRLGGSLRDMEGRRRRARLHKRLARAARGEVFTPDIDYLPAGVGFAADSARGLLFVAGERAGIPAEGLLPLAAFRAYSIGVTTDGLAEDNYLDLLPVNSAAPVWRISCGAEWPKADAIAGRLGSLGLKRA